MLCALLFIVCQILWLLTIRADDFLCTSSAHRVPGRGSADTVGVGVESPWESGVATGIVPMYGQAKSYLMVYMKMGFVNWTTPLIWNFNLTKTGGKGLNGSPLWLSGSSYRISS